MYSCNTVTELLRDLQSCNISSTFADCVWGWGVAWVSSPSRNLGTQTSWTSLHSVFQMLAASWADRTSLSIAGGGWGDSLVYKIQDNWELHSDTASFPNTSAWKQNKAKQKAGKNRKRILSWASTIWMPYYQLLPESQLSRSAGFKLPPFLLFILRGEESPSNAQAGSLTYPSWLTLKRRKLSPSQTPKSGNY